MKFRQARRQGGFTLLEAIVALVVFSMGAVALYGWLGVSLEGLHATARAQDRAAAMQSGVEAMRRVNPMEDASGRLEIGEVSYHWQSRVLDGPRDSVGRLGAPTIFEVALYETDVVVRHGEDEVASFTIRQIGHRQARELGED